MTPRLGTDGTRIVYPIRGIVQGARDVGRHPQRRTLVYVTTLIARCSGHRSRGSSWPAMTWKLRQLFLLSPSVCCDWLRGSASGSPCQDEDSPRQRNSLSTFCPRCLRPCCSDRLQPPLWVQRQCLATQSSVARRDRDRAPRLKWATTPLTRVISGAAMGFAAQASSLLVPSEFGGLSPPH